jgi:hypothetical protein
MSDSAVAPAKTPSSNGHLDQGKASEPSVDKSREAEAKKRRSASFDGSKAAKGAEAATAGGKGSKDVLQVQTPQKEDAAVCNGVAKEGEEGADSLESETQAIKDKLENACNLAAGITELTSRPTPVELRVRTPALMFHIHKC